MEYLLTRRAALKHNSEWLESQINVPRFKCGLIMIATNDEQFEALIEIEAKSRVNGEDVRMLSSTELQLMEPNLKVNGTPMDKSLLTRAYLPCSRGLTGSLEAASMSFSQL